MKKIFKYAMLFAMACSLTTSMTSCSSDDDVKPSGELSAGDKYLQQVLSSYVDNTVNPTYKALADESEKLYKELEALQPGSITQQQVNDVCKTFLEARGNYERSEAFLLGAASHFLIDPHIDSWPLDLQSLYNYIKADKKYKISDQSILGFHGIEFILFRDGQPRKAAELNGHDTYNDGTNNFTIFTGAQELEYAKAVAEDLRNSVYRLECSWNEDATKAHKDVLDELETSYTTDKGNSYGYEMKHAGDPVNSQYATVKIAVSSVLSGDNSAAGIADEVGNTKINNPFSGKDESYIESPYSYNSLTDFQNNIHSIENVWYGGVQGKRSEYSFSNYFKKYDAATGKRVEAAIANALKQIAAIKSPFVKNIKDPQCANAIKACKELNDALTAASDFIGKNNK